MRAVTVYGATWGRSRRRFLGVAAMTAAAAGLHMWRGTGAASDPVDALGAATTWINSTAYTRDALRGRVVAVQFGTFTCINWLRTLPYVRAWQQRYTDLLIVGVHTPEFAFERQVDEVKRALERLDVTFPMAVDNEYTIWRAFGNRYWPALYLLDGTGTVKYRHFGEGEYVRSERRLQRMLAAAGAPVRGDDVVAVTPSGIERQADWGSLRSGEAYVGYGRAQQFASPGGMARDRQATYTAPTRLGLDAWALSGPWTVGREAAVVGRLPARLTMRFHARDVHLVMGPASSAVPFRVTLDGAPPGPNHGLDVDEHGRGLLAEPRLHQLVRQPGPIVERHVGIEFLAPGASVYAFTFG